MQFSLNKIAERIFRAEPRQDGSRRQKQGDEAFSKELEAELDDEAQADEDALVASGRVDEDDASNETADEPANENQRRLVRITPRAPNPDGKGLKLDVFA